MVSGGGDMALGARRGDRVRAGHSRTRRAREARPRAGRNVPQARGERRSARGRGHEGQPPGRLMDAAQAASGAPEAIVCDRFRLPELRDCANGAKVTPRVARWSEAGEDIRGLRRAALDGPLSVAESSRALLAAEPQRRDGSKRRRGKHAAHQEVSEQRSARRGGSRAHARGRLVRASTGAPSAAPAPDLPRVSRGSRLHTLIGRRVWAGLRARVFRRDGYRCRACGRPGRLECDHIRPLRQGGALLDPANLQSLCRRCHISKTRGENSRPITPERARWIAFIEELRE